ncbi:MAG: hypothetical protein ACI4MI_04705 [Christensenellales bacterium]
MKKILIVAIIACMAICSLGLVACQNETTEQYTLVAPDGAPALSVAGLIGSEIDGNKFDVQIVASSQIAEKALTSDFAVVPANLAAKMYNSGEKVKLLASVTNGNLYIMSTVDKNNATLSDLVGKQVYSIGQGSVPDMVFKTLLSAGDIQFVVSESVVEGKVAIKYVADGSEAISLLKAAQNNSVEAYGIIGEPACTASLSKGLFRTLDLQALWQENVSSDNKGYAQAVLIAKGNVVDNTRLLDAVIDAFKANEQYIIDDTASAVAAIKSVYPQSSLPDALSSQIVERCNIKTYDSADYFEYIDKTLEVVYNIAPNAIGGTLPDRGLYR